MRRRGINYDTGFLPGEQLSRPVFTAEAAARDMRAIAGELHCDAVRVSGRDAGRLAAAARAAAAEGLEVWLAPFPVDLGATEMLALFEQCAGTAEELRRGGAEVVFVTGCEISLFGDGFIPGRRYGDRIAAMAGADLAWWQALAPVVGRLNGFLAEAVAAVRARFGGRVTYASGPWEAGMLDWGPFDLVGVDAYRASYNRATFAEELRGHARHGKPVAVTEFGTCPYAGAGERGGMAWTVPDGAVRDEGEQVRYFEELSDAFEEAGIDTALWFTFAAYGRPGSADPTAALGSYGVVEVASGEAEDWAPREVFAAMAARYGAAAAG